MFRKLKLLFILTNVGIITALFISLTVGAYILLQIKMMNHAEFFAERMASGIISGAFQELPFPMNKPTPPGFKEKPPYENVKSPGPFRDAQPFRPVIFFVKIDSHTGIFYQSFNQPYHKVQLKSLVQRVINHHQSKGVIRFDRTNYYFYQAPLQKEAGKLLIFQDLKQDKNIQQALVISLIITGIIYLILSMVGSLLMANKAIGPIRKAWEQQKKFLADASHELRTPLAIIQTNLEVVLSNPQGTVASQFDWLSNMKEELQEMAVLVNSLLFLARIDSQQYQVIKRYFMLDQLLSRVVDAFQPIAFEKKLTINLSIDHEISFCGDESNIRQLIQILLDNAVRYTPAGGEISVQLQQLEKKVQIIVCDNGEGIDPIHLDKIFDRFYQADTSRSKSNTGLGLSIAKSIVESHQGTIQVASIRGAGATFTVQLPIPKESDFDSPEAIQIKKPHF